MSLFNFESLKDTAQEVLGQLFTTGPTWDGDILSKEGRDKLIDEGLVMRREGWAYLTDKGVLLAVRADITGRFGAVSGPNGTLGDRWRRKQQNR